MFIRNQAHRSNVRHEQRGIKAQKESYNTPQKRELIKHHHQIVIKIIFGMKQDILNTYFHNGMKYSYFAYLKVFNVFMVANM